MSSERILDRKHRHLDPQYCGMIMRIGAVACVILVLCAVAVLTLIDPSSTRCRGWLIAPENGTSVPIWGFVAIAAGWTLVVCYYAVTWRRFAQRLIETIEWGERTWVTKTTFSLQDLWEDWDQLHALCARSINSNHFVLLVMVASAVFAAIPLIIMAAECA
jgi:hypothetical protein